MSSFIAIFISLSFPCIAVKSACIVLAPLAIYVDKSPVSPVVNATVPTDVASTTDLPWVTVAASATVIVRAQVAVWSVFDDKSSSSSILPLIVVVTVPVVTSVTKFRWVIWLAVIVFIAAKVISISLSFVLIAVKSPWIALLSIQFANVSDIPVVNVIAVTDVASTTDFPVVTVTASATVIVNAHVPAWLAFADKSSNSAILPSIVAVTVPVVTFVTKFTWAIWLAVIVFIVPKFILISLSFVLIAVKLLCIAPVSIQFAKLSTIPVVNATVASDVASTTVFPVVTVTASATVIVNAHVAVWLVFDDKSSNWAILPSIVAVTVPVVTSVTKFKCVIWSAVIVFIAANCIFISVSLFFTAVKSPWIAFVSIQFANVSDIPVVNATVSTDVASTTAFAAVTVAASATVIVNAHVAVWLAFVDKSSSSAILPSIVPVTVPVVKSVNKFKWVICVELIVFTAANVIFTSVSLFFIAVNEACTESLSIQFANVSDTPAAEKSTVVIDVASTIVLPWATVTASSTTIVNAHVALVPFAAKSSNSSAFPSILAVTVPVVAAAILFIWITWFAVISDTAGVTTIFISPSLFLISVRLAWIAFPEAAIYVAKAPVKPAAEKSTVAIDVASTIVLPCATVATSSTTIVNAHVALVPLAAKSSNSATLPSNVTVTVPVVAAAILFNCVTWSAVIFSIAGVIAILTLASLFLIPVKLPCIVFTPVPM